MNPTVHSYENDFRADVLPRGTFRGQWSGHYVVLDGNQAHVPTDVAVQGSVRVLLVVTAGLVEVQLELQA